MMRMKLAKHCVLSASIHALLHNAEQVGPIAALGQRASDRGELPVVGYELDGVDYTFANGLPSPTGDDGTPSSLEILALTPVTWDEENHGQSGSLLTMGDFTLRFAATSLLGEDTPANRDKLRYGSAVITSMPKGLGEVFCAGTTEWCYALAAHEEQCEIITRNVVNRFLA